jgi:peroxiredoxin
VWVEDQSFQYEVWSDTDRTLAEYYDDGLSEGALAPRRVTFLLDAEGNLLLEYPPSMTGDVGGHPGEVLEDCTMLFGP